MEDLEALIAEAGGSASVYGLSSGAVLAVEAAARGAAITKLVLFEPPLPIVDNSDTGPDLVPQLAQLIASGRRGDAVEFFMTRVVGLPAEFARQAKASPMWPGLEAMAHTIGYDLLITADRTLWTERAASVNAPTLVLDSEASAPYLHEAARRAAEALPHGQRRSLRGQHHNVPADVLASEMSDFLR